MAKVAPRAEPKPGLQGESQGSVDKGKRMTSWRSNIEKWLKGQSTINACTRRFHTHLFFSNFLYKINK
jgi:hypothetical protein